MGVRFTAKIYGRLRLLFFLVPLFLCPVLAQSPSERLLQEAQKLDDEFQSLYHAGNFAEALPRGERVLALREQALGAEHPSLASTLLLVALVYRDKGSYTQAEQLLRRALALQEKAVGENHPDFIGCLFNLAIVCRLKGGLAVAATLYQRTIALSEKLYGTEHLELTGALQELAILHSDKGEPAQAEPLFQRVLLIREKAQGKEHPDVASCLFNLAILHRNKGDYARAEPLFQRALAVQEKALGMEHPDVANTLYNWAIQHRIQGELNKAEPLLRRALAIQEKRFGTEHPEITGTLNELAVLYTDRKDFVQAEPMLLRLLAFREKTVGGEHYDVATTLSDLANLYLRQGAYTKAAPLLQRALTILEKIFGPQHREVGEVLGRQARLYEAQGDIAQAVQYQARVSQVREHNLVLNLAIGSEAQKRAAVQALAYELDLTLSLHLHTAPHNTAARDLALTDLLRRKGRAVEAMSDSFGALRARADAQGRAWLDELLALRSQLAGLLLNSNASAPRQQSEVLAAQIETLEARISERSAEFRVQTQPVTIAALQALLPADAALLEFAIYHPFEVRTGQFREAHYAAYLLRATGEPQWVELGVARAIDDAIGAWRKTLRDPRTLGTVRLARAVGDKLMRPLRALLGDVTHLLIAPDGALNLIPFAALVDEQNKYLIERYTITYLTSGRDLLRLQATRESRSPAVIIADPAFGDLPLVYDKKQARLDESKVMFEPLPGAQSELRALQELLPEATVLSRSQATEAALKRVRAPRLLHIATHGFFWEETPPVAPAVARRQPQRKAAPTTRLAKVALQAADPMLRSGLAFAGANQGKSGPNQIDDGVLTAMEAVGLDLWGTKLVALSACDTGVGEVKNGEGIYGLRRAFVLAGAESQLMSLWPVSDRGTRNLMIGYYQALQQGQGRGAALRQVQLQMLRSTLHQHPFYWASFIQSGEWADLAGKR